MDLNLPFSRKTPIFRVYKLEKQNADEILLFAPTRHTSISDRST